MLYALLMFVGGCLIGMQGPINAALGRVTGQFEASLINFCAGTLVLLPLVAIVGKGSVFKVFEAPWWQWTGGIFGATLVFAAIVSVPKIGALSASLAMICGSLIMAAIIDNYGWFGSPHIPFTLRRALGVALVAGGFYFIFKK